MGDTNRLRRLAQELRDREETTQSLEVASSRQQSMMPDAPVIPGFDLAVDYYPASEVSGDFYDFFITKNGEQAIVIADVTGHGVEAGIIMGMAKATVNIYGRIYDTPLEVLKAANRDLAASLDGKTFICLTLVFLDPGSKRLRLARAGADRPIYFNSSWEPPEPRDIRTRGLALGLDGGERFNELIEQAEIMLQPGDLLLQFTDGIVEAANSDKEQFGEERIMEIVKKYPRASSRELIFLLKETLLDFTRSREYDDDITIVALKLRDQPVSRKIAFD
ncbi:MAG: PP2C family protein-serine/threonine phosphatase [Planctomycetes bacterium]|nr:PP2C family protein-serine/threonine phosphatase [Planctomycetota bacterium]